MNASAIANTMAAQEGLFVAAFSLKNRNSAQKDWRFASLLPEGQTLTQDPMLGNSLVLMLFQDSHTPCTDDGKF